MASWRKHFKLVNADGAMSPIAGSGRGGAGASFGFQNYASRLPEVYSGHPNRVERYNQYEAMDTDAQVNACLDIIAEFSTQEDQQNSTPFTVKYREDPTDHEVKIIKEQLQQWVKLNQFDQRIFKIFRNALKYGDQVFVRDPQTFELYYVDMTKVSRVIVNETQGKRPEQYVIRDINPNFQNLTISQIATDAAYSNQPQMGSWGGQPGYTVPSNPYNQGSRFQLSQNESAIAAEHVVHISLTEGLDFYWPFGQSILESIFKVYKQKELLEDSILIYRVQRAPERRVFYIDVGNMPSHLAMQFVERVKNEIHQKRIPTMTGGSMNILDAAYNPLCLDLSTEIPLLDGRTLRLSELISEFEQGRENWTYSCDPSTGRVVPGLINWAGITRRDTAAIKLTLDNGQTLICTPDHKIPVFGRGFVEAQHLTTEDSLISFNVRDHAIAGGKTNRYQQVWDHEEKNWVFTHRMVGEFFRSRGKHQEFCYLPEHANLDRDTIHHRDHDRFNNDPRNLTYMNKKDHVLYHAAQKQEFWETMTPEYRAEITGKISQTLKDRWANLTEQQRVSALWNIRAAQQKSVWARQNDPATAARYRSSMQRSRREYFQRCPAALDQVKKNLENRVKIKNQPLNLTFDMLQCVADIVRSGEKNKNRVLDLCDNNTRLLGLVRQANSRPLDYANAQCKIDFDKFGYSKMDRLLEKFGYKNWKHFVREIDNFNHRIVSIEPVENRDTGTITIDGHEQWHNYHTFATAAGIFVKNSINEDYFFPQTAEGRGSKVEMLQGGQAVGEIDDLKYFNNLMMRGLRVPSSYLPTGPDDSSTPLSDGRVGTALIQEKRFNEYCKRLQRLVIQKLDQEFKLFLRWRGFNIDAGLFDIDFNDPQNFAAYRETELDQSRVQTFSSLEALPYMSKRFLMQRYLGLTEEEILENEELWREEREDAEEPMAQGSELRSVGISPGGIESDLAAIPPQGAAPDLGATAEPGAEPQAPGPTAPPSV